MKSIKYDPKKYNIWYLNLALYMRSKIRNWCLEPRRTQAGTISHKFLSFFNVLLDVTHQETFSCTIPNRNAQDMRLFGFHVPKAEQH